VTSHLPECLLADFDDGKWTCICAYLRSCEIRVRTECGASRTDAASGVGTESYRAGFDAAISAAVAAVEDELEFAMDPGYLKERAVEAIRGLRVEEQ